MLNNRGCRWLLPSPGQGREGLLMVPGGTSTLPLARVYPAELTANRSDSPLTGHQTRSDTGVPYGLKGFRTISWDSCTKTARITAPRTNLDYDLLPRRASHGRFSSLKNEKTHISRCSCSNQIILFAVPHLEFSQTRVTYP